jgi:hypothetical protein
LNTIHPPPAKIAIEGAEAGGNEDNTYLYVTNLVDR